MQENNVKYIEEDEIDLRELFKTLMRRKKFIIIFTGLVTLFSVIYVLFKNPIPVYSGTTMVEIGVGVGVGDAKSQVYFDNPNNLKSVIEQKYSVSATVPKKTNNILLITANNTDKNKIKITLEQVVIYILEKHKGKLKLYDKFIMTKQVGDIEIGATPINKPKKKSIVVVAFVTGLILSIFMVFFLEFIRNEKEEDKV